MNEARNYEYTDAAAGECCVICRRPFRLGETIKLYDPSATLRAGYNRRVCISAATCVRKLQDTPIPAPPPAIENTKLTEALKLMTAAARRNYGGDNGK